MHKILVIIVIYNKSIHDLNLIQNINENNDKDLDIFIYDNSPNPQNIPTIDGINIYYEHDKKNSGVSRAYNQGAVKAQELGKDIILLLDQDTNFRFQYLKKYLLLYNQYGNEYIYAPIISDQSNTKIYSPSYMQNFVGKALPINEFEYMEKYNLTDKSAINSGLMLPLTAFKKIGGFNEKIKLDFSDIYFIEKYKTINIDIILLDIYIEHSISGDEGKNYGTEMHRYKYYCNGAKELSSSLSTSTVWTVTRRMLRLVQKYSSLKPISIYINYYLGNKKI